MTKQFPQALMSCAPARTARQALSQLGTGGEVHAKAAKFAFAGANSHLEQAGRFWIRPRRSCEPADNLRISVIHTFMVFPATRSDMAQQNTAADEAQTQNDPELAAANLAEAADSLQVAMTRGEMREMCRSLDLSGYSGTKAEMAETMLEQALDASVAYLAEEGVEIVGELAALTGRQDEEEQDTEEAEDEQDAAASSPDGSLAMHLLARHPEDYGYTAKLACTEKQTAALVAAFSDLEAEQAEVAEAAGCTQRYANSVLNRWRGTEDEVEAVEAEGVQVPAEYVGVMPEDEEEDEENEGEDQ